MESGVIIDPKTKQRIWTAGTLRYTKGGLIILFFWLVWNDFFLMLMEAVKPALTGLLNTFKGEIEADLGAAGIPATGQGAGDGKAS